ncbi:MAG: methionine--tRNA ligase [Candidatus Bathyarchaeota archaeon]
MGRVLITAALPYANAKLHLGHLRSTYIPGDIYARYLRLQGNDVVFICATDEHGTPIAIRAEREGITPQQVVDKYYQSISEDLKRIGCSFNEFGRTTCSLHYEFTQEFFTRLLRNGYLYKAEYEQLFCLKCQRFLPDRFVEGTCPHCGGEARGDQCESCGRYLKPVEIQNPHCVTCGTVPETRQMEHWFFKLSSFRNFLGEWIKSTGVLSSNARNYTLQWLSEDLVDWCITRDMRWGVPVPVQGAEGKIIYVWFDAPIGYISTTALWAKLSGDAERWKEFWVDKDSQIIHFIGKDIIYHHSIFWPAMLRAHGEYNLPIKIVAGEYLTLSGKKMSKSRNWSVEVDEYLEKFEVDPLRYYLIVVSPLSKDADFTWEEYVRKNNDELADILGNFIHRTLMFTYQFFNAEIPKSFKMDEDDKQVLKTITKTKELVESNVDEMDFHQALRELMTLAATGNKYLNDKQPWQTIKVEPNVAAATLYTANQVVKALAVMLEPFLPFTAEKIWEFLNLKGSIHKQKWNDICKGILSGHKINRPQPLFRKIEKKEIPQTLGCTK